MIEIIPNWHPIFVHFTVALLSTSLGLFILATVLGKKGIDEPLIIVARWNLWIGALISIITVAAGWYAYNTVAHDTPSHLAMTEHRNLAMITFALMIPLAIWSFITFRKQQQPAITFVAAFLVVGGLLGATAWHGGEVVYRYGLGVMSLPKTDSHDHGAHSHGEDSGHGDSVESSQDDHHAHDNSDGHHDKGHNNDDGHHDEMEGHHDDLGGQDGHHHDDL